MTSNVINSLTGYATYLQTGSASPLDAHSQYSLAQRQFESIESQAEQGNTTALGELQGYAQNFLSASQNLYGSGAQYASDYQEVLQVLQAVAAIPQSTLTAAYMSAALQDQTDQLIDTLAALQTALNAIQLELQQKNARPSS